MSEDEKVLKIGHYKLIIKDEDDEKFTHSAELYKNGKLLIKFRSAEPITEDNAFEFFLDKTLLKRKTQGLNFIEKN